jgi:hypothetical protein
MLKLAFSKPGSASANQILVLIGSGVAGLALQLKWSIKVWNEPANSKEMHFSSYFIKTSQVKESVTL